MTIREFLEKDAFAAALGIQILEVTNGKAKTKMEIKEEHLNAVYIAHGGVIFSLADFTLAAAANSYGNIAVSIQASIHFLNAAKKGMIYAEAKEISKNQKLATYEITVTSENKELIATYQGMVYQKKEIY